MSAIGSRLSHSNRRLAFFQLCSPDSLSSSTAQVIIKRFIFQVLQELRLKLLLYGDETVQASVIEKIKTATLLLYPFSQVNIEINVKNGTTYVIYLINIYTVRKYIIFLILTHEKLWKCKKMWFWTNMIFLIKRKMRIF